jgi:hypothetical protein
MSTLVIFAIANCGEALRAMPALVRFFSCVSAHMHEQVPFLSKYLSTAKFPTLKEVVTRVSRLDMKIKP